MHETMLVPVSFALFVVALVVSAAVALRSDDAPVSAPDAQAAGFGWVGVGEPEGARREGETWEVDVARPNGSLVEVTIGDQLELLELDEELGPGRRPAHDELTGPVRYRAMRAAMAVTGPGQILSVERDLSGEREVIEVNLRRTDGAGIEVGLDAELRVVEVQAQELGDE